MNLNDNKCSRDRYLSKEMESKLFFRSLRENVLPSSLSLFFSTHVHDFVYPSSSSLPPLLLPLLPLPLLLALLFMSVFVPASFTQTSLLYISFPASLSSTPCIPLIDFYSCLFRFILVCLCLSFHRRRERAEGNKKTETIGQEDPFVLCGRESKTFDRLLHLLNQ